MEFKQNISLKPYNTFGVDVLAKRFISVNSVKELVNVLSKEKDIFILSGGSNILLTNDISKLVVHINTKGISIAQENDDFIDLTVNAGENWHNLVLWCVDKNYGGLENLSLIPGAVGTCPIQNIGAYGVEVKDVITKVTAIDRKTLREVEFSNNECKFGYRDSIFKSKEKGRYIITSVNFRLTKRNHILQTSYGAIKNILKEKDISYPCIKDISDAVISIRESKLPNPKEIGNGGSFFKNPIVSNSKFQELLNKFPEIPSYTVSKNQIKIPAGWLIEKAGFKGKKYRNYGVHENQALVLVNYGGASGKDIYNLAKKIQTSINSKFGIVLEIEVNIIS